MKAYIIARVEVTDWSQYQNYTKATPAVVAKFGGRFIVRGGQPIALEGPAETRRIVIIEFPSLAQAKAFYESPDYSKVKTLRAGAAEGQFLLVEGYAELSTTGSISHV